jgi:hypothetical protein
MSSTIVVRPAASSSFRAHFNAARSGSSSGAACTTLLAAITTSWNRPDAAAALAIWRGLVRSVNGRLTGSS